MADKGTRTERKVFWYDNNSFDYVFVGDNGSLTAIPTRSLFNSLKGKFIDSIKAYICGEVYTLEVFIKNSFEGKPVKKLFKIDIKGNLLPAGRGKEE